MYGSPLNEWYDNKINLIFCQLFFCWYTFPMSEATTLTNQIIDHIYRAGGYAWRSSSVGVFDTSQQRFRAAAKKGVADVLACYQGLLVAVEVKIGKDRISPEQEGFLANIIAAGGYAFIAKNLEDFREWWSFTFQIS